MTCGREGLALKFTTHNLLKKFIPPTVDVVHRCGCGGGGNITRGRHAGNGRGSIFGGNINRTWDSEEKRLHSLLTSRTSSVDVWELQRDRDDYNRDVQYVKCRTNKLKHDFHTDSQDLMVMKAACSKSVKC